MEEKKRKLKKERESTREERWKGKKEWARKER